MRIKWLSLIRTIGFLLVLLYHFFKQIFPGGFIGVDLFFTLSGFLTTALLIDEFQAKGKIDLFGFFHRRFYRIFPPLVLMILLSLPLALLVRNDFIASIGLQVSAALGFMTNFFEILAGGSYENQFSPHLFVHTWSLAIEVQFYLIWVLAVFGMTKISKSSGQLRGTIFLTSSALFLLSFLGMFVSSFFVSNFSSIYYSTFTHIFPFFLGSILATMTGVKNTTRAFEKMVEKLDVRKTIALFAGGLVVEILLLFFLTFDSILTYTIGFLLSSLATASMIYAARVLHEKTPNMEEPALLGYFSSISYGIYLFHWPLFVIFSQLFQLAISVPLTLVFSIIFASLSFYVIEPNLQGKKGNLLGLDIDFVSYSKWFYPLAGLLTLACLGISLFAPRLGGFEKESLASNLVQAQTQMDTTRAAAENAQATNYNVQAGVTIFGDSVTVRASTAIQEVLPDAVIDGTVSRHLTEAKNLIELYKKNNTLKETVVISLGTNTSDNYQELLDDLVANFPKGHRLIFVTPYDGNFSQDTSLAYQTGQYEKELAKENDFSSIADWYQVAVANPAIWVGSDLVHFNLETNGAELFATTIQDAVEAAADGPVKE
ncbi:acyltransferase [Streptococcus suis]|uniref:Acyltransferase n=1 Tax=Streptococcus suis TaxID=1307 RepID=A0A4T2GJ25_STRSU|nr:acyltransferase [Streptococcus suis]MBM7270319.1 acyltransferase [Streptococcus suis]TIH98895.1 acyltransferase [Streptococcus suis]